MVPNMKYKTRRMKPCHERTCQAPKALPRNMKLCPEMWEEQGLPNPTAFDISAKVKNKKTKKKPARFVKLQRCNPGVTTRWLWLTQVACQKECSCSSEAHESYRKRRFKRLSSQRKLITN